MVVLGGMRSVTGPLLGAVVLHGPGRVAQAR